jgi:hypothetical protein
MIATGGKTLWAAPWQAICLSVAVAAVVGIGYSPAALYLLPLAALPMAVFASGWLPRLYAYGLYLTFYLGATSPLISRGELVLSDKELSATGLWLLHGILSSLPVLVLRGEHRYLRGAITALLYIIPPFGYLAANNPALSIGLLFPGLGIFGVVAFVLTAGAINNGFPKTRLTKSVAGALFALSCAANGLSWLSVEKTIPAGWTAIDTGFGNTSQTLERRLHVGNVALPNLVKSSQKLKAEDSLIFLPEGLLYDRSELTEYMWESALEGSSTTVVVGLNLVHSDNKLYSSRVAIFGDGKNAENARSVLAEKYAAVTFPVTMWHPWEDFEHYPMGLPNGTFILNGHSVHLSWCYETTLIWPHLIASMQSPDYLVSLENRWSTKGTSLEAAQDLAGRLNARWLGTTLITAINR